MNHKTSEEKCSYGSTLSEHCSGCTDPKSEGTHQGCTIEHGHTGCDLSAKPTETSKEHHTYCEKCGRTSNTVDMFNSCPFCTQTLSTVLEEQRRAFEKIVDDILIDMCTNPDCPDPKEHAQYKPIIKMRFLESAIASNRTVIEKVVNEFGKELMAHKFQTYTADTVLRDGNTILSSIRRDEVLIKFEDLVQVIASLQAKLRESIKE